MNATAISFAPLILSVGLAVIVELVRIACRETRP